MPDVRVRDAMSGPLRLIRATHATGVTELRPYVDREAEAERLAEILRAAIEDRHRLAHPITDRFVCGDPICQALSELQTAAQR